MKKSILTIAILGLFAMLFLNTSVVFAQTVEEDEEGWVQWSDWDGEETELEFGEESLRPAMLATPNPASGDAIKVYYTKLQGVSELAIFDLSGRLQDQATVGEDHQSNGVHLFSLANLSPGIYFVRLTSGLYDSVQKIIVR